MNISGYTDLEYHDSSAPGAEPGFRLHHMSLFFEKRITDQWRFFSEIEYEDGPFIEYNYNGSNVDSECEGCYGKIFLEAMNFTYAWDPRAQFRGGRFFTPAGIWSIDHYPPFVPTQLRPQHIREIFPQVVDGVTVFGTLPLGGMFVNYDIYLGNGEGNPGSEDGNSEKATGAKLSLLFPALKYLEIGASIYNDTQNDDQEKEAIGAHLKLKIWDFTLQGEYATATNTPVSGSSFDQSGYYAQLLYDIGKWTLGGRYDFYDAQENTQSESIYNSVFVNYHVTEAIVLKLEHHQVELEDPAAEDYDHTIGSVVIYLGN
ncbi:MAG: porin [Gammaproteobacteria bacterium]|nr:porin [Gammaproteobacteria bacterium]